MPGFVVFLGCNAKQSHLSNLKKICFAINTFFLFAALIICLVNIYVLYTAGRGYVIVQSQMLV